VRRVADDDKTSLSPALPPAQPEVRRVFLDHASIVADLANEVAATNSGTENFEDELDMDGTDVSTDDSTPPWSMGCGRATPAATRSTAR
jgi:hypothetical protein